ncbi:MAG: DEAD/DEAH box helicase, partial [Chloroflexota bacterium]|nr:DEAD/DEAH box helicase [Chloroflexota bacterium]
MDQQPDDTMTASATGEPMTASATGEPMTVPTEPTTDVATAPATNPATDPAPAPDPGPQKGSFEQLQLSEPILRSLDEMGFDEPTPVQARAIPCLLEGRDVVAQALTGTGKTAAYGIPLVERVDYARAVPQAIILVPTRELAVQVTEQLVRIGRHHDLRVTPIYGGQPYDRQLYTLRRGVHTIVATPGRLMDHMRRGTVDLSTVCMLVLDEADQMLEMGFVDDVEFIIGHLPNERITALFSATMPEPILALARKHMRNPEMVMLSAPRGLTAPDIAQSYYVVPFPRKHDALCRTLMAKRPERVLVFCATKRMVDEVVQGLQGRGYLAGGLHGDMAQRERERTLRAFRDGRIEALVATDVAARGIDIPEVTHVINFDIPSDPEAYVHRIGRTGRLGRKGEAITFVNPREQRALRIIERVTGAPVRRDEVPTVAEAEERTAAIIEERLLDAVEAGEWRRYRPIVEELLDGHDPIDLAAAALCLAAGQNRRLALPDGADGGADGDGLPARTGAATAQPGRPGRPGTGQRTADRGFEPRGPRHGEGRPPFRPGDERPPRRPPVRSDEGDRRGGDWAERPERTERPRRDDRPWADRPPRREGPPYGNRPRRDEWEGSPRRSAGFGAGSRQGMDSPPGRPWQGGDDEGFRPPRRADAWRGPAERRGPGRSDRSPGDWGSRG